MTGTIEARSSPVSDLTRPEGAASDPEPVRMAGRKLSRSVPEIVRSFGLAVEAVHASEPRSENYGQYRDAQDPGTGACKIMLPPLKTGLGIVVPGLLVAKLVDGFYGGSGQVDALRHGFTAAEERILGRFGAKIAEALASAWGAAVSGPARLAATYTEPESALFSPHEAVAIQTLALAGGPADGLAITLLYPASGMRALAPAADPVAADPGAVDPQWHDKVIDAVLNVRLPLRTIFARAEIPLSDLLALQVGDVIPICLPSRIPVTVGDRRFAQATVGEANGRTSILIESLEGGEDYDD